MKFSKRQRKIINLIDEIGVFLGYVPQYSNQDIYNLWKQSGLTYNDVSDYFCKSPERIRQYCHGEKCSNKLKIQIARYFKDTIYDKNINYNPK